MRAPDAGPPTRRLDAGAPMRAPRRADCANLPPMGDPSFAHLALLHTLDGLEVPRIARRLAGATTPELAWRNDLDGLTFRIGARYLKWNPRSTGIDLERERVRLEWLSSRHPAPRVVGHGVDGDAQWLLTEALPGGPAVGDEWRARRPEAIAAIAAGLRAIHAIPIDDVPAEWAAEGWVGRQPRSLGPRPPVDDAVLVHGDACAPNTLISADGAWTATSTSATWRSATAGRTWPSPR